MSLLGVIFAASLMLILLASAGLMFTQEREAIKRIDRRRHGLTRARTLEEAMPPPRLADFAPKPPALERIARLFGYNTAIPDQYPVPWWGASLIALVIARGGVWLLGNLVGAVAILAWLPFAYAILRFYFSTAAQHRRNILFKQFPDALGMITRAARVGIPMQEAVRTVARETAAPTSRIFARVADEMAIGHSLDEALRTPARDTGLPEYRFFSTAVALQSQTGGGLAVMLDTLADTIRKRVAAKSRGKALAAEARASALVLAILPVAAAAVMMVLAPGYMSQLFTTKLGKEIMTAAILIEGSGIFSMRVLIQRALS